MTEALNPEPLLRALHDAGVRDIIIGSFAVNAHGVIRPSKDLDIVPDPEPANLERLAALLAELDARHVGAGDMKPEEFPFDPTRPEDLRAGANFQLETNLGDLDVMQWVAGMDTTPPMRRSPPVRSRGIWTDLGLVVLVGDAFKRDRERLLGLFLQLGEPLLKLGGAVVRVGSGPSTNS
jgi:hypothetical protein